jgi:Fe-S cluster assembly protein SufD
VSDALAPYRAAFERFADAPATNGGGQPWLAELRREAMGRFLELGFPTPRLEEWRFTDVSPIAKASFALPGGTAAAVSLDALRPYLIGNDVPRLVFVDGRFVAGLSQAPSGVVAMSLAEALHDRPADVRKYLASRAPFAERAFTALNTALWSDGAYVVVPRGVAVELPIHLLFVTTADNVMVHPRHLIVVGAAAQVTFVESYVSLGAGAHLTNSITEMVIEDGAHVEHVKLQAESEKAFHTATVEVAQGRGSNLTTHSFALGGAIVRNDWNTALEAEGAECTLNGLYVPRGRQLVDNHTSIDHVSPHCSSRELYKGILNGRSRSVFHGKITVRPDAQKTDARQTNKNLVLSDDTSIDSKPQLEIFANDVKCAHGATVGQIDKQSAFYLRSRGIDEASARRILTYAFAAEMIDKVSHPGLRLHLAGLVAERLPAGTVSLEAVGV